LEGVKLTYGNGKGQLLGNNATGLQKQTMLLLNEEGVARATIVTKPR
jgi:hypothetical protein